LMAPARPEDVAALAAPAPLVPAETVVFVVPEDPSAPILHPAGRDAVAPAPIALKFWVNGTSTAVIVGCAKATQLANRAKTNNATQALMVGHP